MMGKTNMHNDKGPADKRGQNVFLEFILLT